ncbi:MAG TPA: hypothetical protein VG324_14500 [Blastocatellia bacterium]|nr:hypothetical protein [Blastocatellia bacterium]
MAKIPEHIRRRRRLRSRPAITVPPIEKITEPKFKQRLLSRFFVRFHMTLMLGAVTISGVGASKLLLELDVNWMLIRYPIAVCAAYGIFFFSIKVWLWYIGLGWRKKGDSEDESEFDDEYDFDSEPADFSSPDSGSVEHHWIDSGGGSPTESWGNALYEGSSTSSSPSGGSGFDFLPDLDLGDEGCVVVILLLALLGLLLLGVFGAGIFLIYQSPAILAEAAFQAALASGLISATRRIEYGDWSGSVFKATWIPFAIVLAAAIGFGWAAQHYCPAATKAAEIFYLCR